MNTSQAFASVALPLITLSGSLFSERSENGACEPTFPAPCNAEDCSITYCRGPVNYGVNAAVNPLTCNGDWVLNVQGLLWKVFQNGLEFAIKNDKPIGQLEHYPEGKFQYQNAEYCSPDFKANFGFKIDLGYSMACDGWDLGLTWTKYKGSAASSLQSAQSRPLTDVRYLYPSNAGIHYKPAENLSALLSNFGQASVKTSYLDYSNIPQVYSADAKWALDLNLLDLELGRNSWNSRCLSLRPFIGFRFASLSQNYDVTYSGGWSLAINQYTDESESDDITQYYSETIKMKNDFTGKFGLRAGLGTTWNFFCGWGVYGNFAVSTVYGKFKSKLRDSANPSFAVNEDEDEYIPSFYGAQVLANLSKEFSALRFMTDISAGIQWSSLICDCKYGVTVAMGWEHHQFLNQNQLFYVSTDWESEIVFVEKMRGDLSTQGGTLSVILSF